VSANPATCGTRCRTVSLLVAAAAGALFGAGLLVSGMTQPAKVIGFLDVASGWDPSLAFVMGGAVVVYGLAFAWIRRGRTEPWFDGTFHVPTRRDVDVPLLAGAAIFGVGWGLGGLCPGPGLVAAAAGSSAGVAFVAAMLAGMLGQHAVARITRS
jgi:uncharacterized membrane protein YedE/YeeE